MIWLTWRQNRTEILMLAGLLALILVALVLTGVPLHDLFNRLHLASCQLSWDAPPCQNGMDVFFTRDAQYNQVRSMAPFLNLFVALPGILVGVPLLAREYEQGTQRLAWTQSVPRLRWLRTKLALLVGGAVALALVLTVVMTWWNEPWVAIFGQFELPSYDFAGVVPLAYAALAMALGVSFGAVLRRSIPAVVCTLLGYAALWMGMDNWLRQRLVPAITRYYAPWDGPSTSPHDWFVAQGYADRLGHPISSDAVDAACRGTTSFLQCATDHGWRGYVVFHPASQFWQMQGVEAAILLALALALLALTLWWTRTHAG